MLRNLNRCFAWKFKQDPIQTWRIVQGDVVRVITGKDKGKEGKIVKVTRKYNLVTVEGINMKIKHNKPGAEGGDSQSGKVIKEFPIHVSNVMLIDPETK